MEIVHEDEGLWEFSDRLSNQIKEYRDDVKSLKSENKRIERLFSSMKEGILTVDENQKLIGINKAGKYYLGIKQKKKALIGENLVNVFRHADLINFVKQTHESSKKYHETEIELSPSNIESIQVRVTGVKVLEDGEAKGVLIVMHDITRLKTLEKIRQEFVANVSHELKTPLTAIHGFINPVRESLETGDEKLAEHYLKIIEKHSKRMYDIIRDLLKISNLEQQDSNKEIDFSSHNLKEVVNQAINHHQHKLDAKKIELSLDLVDVKIMCNNGLLEQAFGNLIDNAIKYSDHESKISISIRAKKNFCSFKIIDEGIGIPEEHQEHIFKRFYRVDKSRDRKTGGTGLGLSIVKHIVRIHGGDIKLKSDINEGSTFSIILPIK